MINEIEQLQLGDNPIYEIVIRETMCVRHYDGRVTRKPAGEFHTLRAGIAPKEDEERDRVIDKVKRDRERYEMRGHAQEVWWEAPTPEDMAQGRGNFF